ncbi:MAG: hypothetical protein QXT28_09735 [Thermofilaceae archaeon]
MIELGGGSGGKAAALLAAVLLLAAALLQYRPAAAPTLMELEAKLEPPEEGYYYLFLEAHYHQDGPEPVLVKVDSGGQEFRPEYKIDMGGQPRVIVYVFRLPKGVYAMKNGKCVLCNWNVESNRYVYATYYGGYWHYAGDW